MDIRILKYFCTIADEKSISQAANVLHITQPTLSRQLKELEDELGTALFYREKKQMFLTEAGIFLKNRAEEILYLTSQTEKDFLDQKKELFSGHISIGCVEADNSDTLAMMLEEMVRDYPQITFNIFSGTSDDITERLDKGIIDLAILLEPTNTLKYEKIVLPRSEKWGILVSKESFLSEKDEIEPEDLIGVPLMCSGRTEIQKMLSNWIGIPFAEGKNGLFNNALLKGIGEKYNKSVAQVITRWLVQRDIIVLAKSVNENRIQENIDVFDFELTDEDIAIIQGLNTNTSQFFDHRDPEMVKGLSERKLDI